VSYRIQAKYDELARAAVSFRDHADQVAYLRNATERCVQRLQDGDWEEWGAERFFKEMEDFVFPGINRLENALHEARNAVKQIVQILHQAEQDAGNLFRSGGGPPEMRLRRRQFEKRRLKKGVHELRYELIGQVR